MNKKHGLLIVDDEIANLQKLKRTFLDDFQVYEATGGEDAIRLLKEKPISIIVTDQRMPGMSGVELLLRSLEINPDVIRIILTGYTEVEDLMDSINQGHVHRYITKPWEPFSLREQVRQELERWELKRENERLAQELKVANERLARENFLLRQEMEVLKESDGKLIYQSKAIEGLLNLLSRVVKTDSTILIQGETGTGKELVARFIHEQSQRAGEAFVAVNCGAIPNDLVESSFFGHRKGAFTGASESRKGFFELANGGTLFLDEIGEAPASLQVKLLRVLQEGEILPVGEGQARKVDVRIVASTNRDLARMVEKGEFRQDLFFRLNVFSVHVPPLRARKNDIPVLVNFFLHRLCRRLNKHVPGIQKDVLDSLLRYDWPGNVRELENEIERLVILCDSGRSITSDLLSERIRFPARVQANHRLSLKEQLAELEKKLILDALEAHNQNKSHAAEALGITRQTIISKLKQYQN
ncbi:MAG TPA: sigma-54 dependent transcriptional regulator [Acidobacteriota bacterium]|nr:sigma-54 dependent transcriptional regulator [Acidobacteriota bacterium]